MLFPYSLARRMFLFLGSDAHTTIVTAMTVEFCDLDYLGAGQREKK
jgi:hypothetical protein